MLNGILKNAVGRLSILYCSSCVNTNKGIAGSTFEEGTDGERLEKAQCVRANVTHIRCSTFNRRT